MYSHPPEANYMVINCSLFLWYGVSKKTYQIVGWVYRYIPTRHPKHESHFSSQNAIPQDPRVHVSVLDTSFAESQGIMCIILFQQKGSVDKKRQKESLSDYMSKSPLGCKLTNTSSGLAEMNSVLCSMYRQTLWLKGKPITKTFGAGGSSSSAPQDCLVFQSRHVWGALPGPQVSGGLFSSKRTWPIHN